MTLPADVSFELSPEDTVSALDGRIDRLVTDTSNEVYVYDVFHLRDPTDGRSEPYFVVAVNDLSMSNLSTLYEEYGFRDRRAFLTDLKRRYPRMACTSILRSIHFRPCSKATGETDSDAYVPNGIRRGWSQ